VAAKTRQDDDAATMLMSAPPFEAKAQEADAWMRPYLKKQCGIVAKTSTTAG